MFFWLLVVDGWGPAGVPSSFLEPPVDRTMAHRLRDEFCRKVEFCRVWVSFKIDGHPSRWMSGH